MVERKSHEWHIPPPNDPPDPMVEKRAVLVTAAHAKDADDLRDLLATMGLEAKR